MWFVASLHLSAKYRKAEGGDTGPRSCKLQRISPGAENDGRAAVVMETPSGGGAWEDGDPLVLLLKITWQAEAPPPLPLPPIQPSRAAAPVSYYKMAAKAPPSTGNPWTSHGKISFFYYYFYVMSSIVKSPSDSFAVCFPHGGKQMKRVIWKWNEAAVKGADFSLSPPPPPCQAKLHFDICVFDAARSAPVGAAVGDPASGSFYILCGLRTLLSPGPAAYSFSPPPSSLPTRWLTGNLSLSGLELRSGFPSTGDSRAPRVIARVSWRIWNSRRGAGSNTCPTAAPLLFFFNLLQPCVKRTPPWVPPLRPTHACCERGRLASDPGSLASPDMAVNALASRG